MPAAGRIGLGRRRPCRAADAEGGFAVVGVNQNLAKLPGNYLFPEIGRRVRAFLAEGPPLPLIRLGIGDVTLPLAPVVVRAMHRAVAEMGRRETFRGYCEETCGAYDFLRFAIRDSYLARGTLVEDDEIFVSDGAKSDCGNIADLFEAGATAAVCDPTYPVYAEACAMAGRAGSFDGKRWAGLIYLPCTPENGFFPAPPRGAVPGLIYLCSPNNPTGTAATREQLQLWVNYAGRHGSVLLYDGAYEAFITQPHIPHSIYEVEGARSCAIEFRSFSKSAGFTGTRCAYAVVPKDLVRQGVSLNALWRRRQSARFNGVPYVVQRAAEAALTPEGLEQARAAVSYYQNNARVLRAGLQAAGLTVYGGVDAPYLWCRTPGGMGSWAFFDLLLREACVVVTPGAGFGPGGEGYVRLTAFGEARDTALAVERIRAVL